MDFSRKIRKLYLGLRGRHFFFFFSKVNLSLVKPLFLQLKHHKTNFKTVLNTFLWEKFKTNDYLCPLQTFIESCIPCEA